MSDVLLSFGVQNAKADVGKMINDLESAFRNSDPVKIKVGLEVDKTALGTFKSQLSKIVNSISLSTGAPITVRIDGIGEISKCANNAKDALNDLSSASKEVDDALGRMTKAQSRKALEKISAYILKMRDNAAKLSNSQYGSGNPLYDKYIDQFSELETLYDDVQSGGMLLKDFTKRFGDIKKEAGDIFKSLGIKDSANDLLILTKGTKEYEEALLKLSKLLLSVKKHQTDWTAAKSGPTSGDYNNLTKYNTELEHLINRLINEELTLKDLNTEYESLRTNVAKTETAIKTSGKATKSLRDRFSGLAEKFASWLSVSQAIMFAVNAIKQVVNTVIELDTSMTELKKVTNETDATYDRFLNKAVDRAKSVGASLSDVVSATADFARLGYGIDEASSLADAAIIYKNVGDGIDSINQAAESITSTMQVFGSETVSAMSIVDKFNEVGNNFAITSTGIGEALQRSAAAMSAAGNSLDETIALVAAANTIVQNPESVGTTLKTISMYLRAAKTEAEEAGESTDGMASSVSELRNEILSLTGGKVDIQSAEDEFKSTYQILQELSQVWDSLTDISQANILELIGGKRNANVVSALLENFSVAESALETSANAAGSALAENEKYLASIQGKISQFQASWQALSSEVVSSDLIGGIVDAGRVIVDSIGWIIDALGNFGIALTSIPVITFIKKLKPVSKILDDIKLAALSTAGGSKSTLLTNTPAIS